MAALFLSRVSLSALFAGTVRGFVAPDTLAALIALWPGMGFGFVLTRASAGRIHHHPTRETDPGAAVLRTGLAQDRSLPSLDHPQPAACSSASR